MKKLSLVALASVALLATACAPNDTKIKIGYIGPVTGDAASYGADTLNATQMKVEEINAKGGINGKMIELIVEDGRCSGAEAASAARKLVNVDKVVAIIGGQCSSETLAAAPIVESAKVILMSPVSSSPDVTKAGEFVFRVMPSDAYKGRELANYMMKQGYNNIAIVSENTDFCQGIRNSIKGALKDGATLVFDEVVDPGTKDYRSLFTRLKAMEFDAYVVNVQSDATGAEMAKQLRELGMKQPLVGSDTSDSATLGSIATEAVEGMRFINTSSKLGEGGSDSFAAKFRAKHGEPKANMSFATLAFDGAGVVFEAIAKVGTDGTKIRDYLYAVTGYEGAAGTLKFDKDGDVLGVGYALKQFKDGKIEEIEDIEIK